MPKKWHVILARSRALRTPRHSSESNREGTKKRSDSSESLLGMWALRDSNPRPSACKADALNQLS